jgi:hypothetical protein
METELALCAQCPWRNAARCPQPIAGPEHGAALNVRLDVARVGFVACACFGAAPDPAHSFDPSRSPREGPDPYLEGSQTTLTQAVRESWGSLQALLHTPMEGLAAVGLSLLPEKLQDMLLEAMEEGRPITFRVNLEPAAVEPDFVSILAFRALAHATGMRLEVEEMQVAPSEPAPVSISVQSAELSVDGTSAQGGK